jgi:hypothetical protein
MKKEVEGVERAEGGNTVSEVLSSPSASACPSGMAMKKSKPVPNKE